MLNDWEQNLLHSISCIRESVLLHRRVYLLLAIFGSKSDEVHTNVIR